MQSHETLKAGEAGKSISWRDGVEKEAEEVESGNDSLRCGGLPARTRETPLRAKEVGPQLCMPQGVCRFCLNYTATQRDSSYYFSFPNSEIAKVA